MIIWHAEPYSIHKIKMFLLVLRMFEGVEVEGEEEEEEVLQPFW